MPPPQHIINPLTGELTQPGNLLLGKTTTLDDILKLYPADELSITDVQSGWVNYTVRNVKLQGKYFNFTFMFLDAVLKMIGLGFTDQPVTNPSWGNWSEDAELQRTVDYNNWLNNEVGFGRIFAWGTISAIYDTKSGAAGITLKYN